ncbi:hypothetical protein EMIHUDRAFT_224222 [Emiliania huxleyi CCMP1516]|uniref:Uncharacterized protein n=2 Tax=Emiliania huxleyi TaxID=2903 RepID=A0A0D3KSR1_EMIH1|nr:hypothetical protein EMIHUDRAFT_224222 [Emiliania huxleyi CCMP1516]EOD38796.1 hypothetical protein EMIHUDRAFT_224222 [Emiliania huxleyi CCMP1516]|eukprot:XP_005791225.1 hypothetical protein EMIHUDRAFT_224222 [Emiliania huxleyi CCMP1516]
MQTDGDSPVTVVEADGEPPATVVEVLAVEEELTPAGIVEELAPAVAVDVLGSSEAVSAATSDACVCSECNKVHPQSNFSRNQWRKPVEQRRCKACVEESLPKPKPSKVEVQRMAREEEARRKLEDSQDCQELESGCYSVPPPCCCLVCFWLQFDESKTRFILGPGNQCIFPWPFPCCIYRSAELRWQNFREGGDLNIQIHTAETQQSYAKWSMKWPPYDGPAFACI